MSILWPVIKSAAKVQKIVWFLKALGWRMNKKNWMLRQPVNKVRVA